MSYVKVVKYYCITCDQPIYKLCSKFKGNEEDVWLFESPLTENDRFYSILGSTTVELN